MKNLILTSVFFLLVISTALANNDSGVPVVLLNSAAVTITVDNASQELFESATISADKNNVDFIAKENISFVQIYDANGKIEFQLPVESNKIRINKNLFAKGNYKLGFKVQGVDELYIAKVNLK